MERVSSLRMSFSRFKELFLNDRVYTAAGYIQPDRIIAGVSSSAQTAPAEIRDMCVLLMPDFYTSASRRETLCHLKDSGAAAILCVNGYGRQDDIAAIKKYCEQTALPMLILPEGMEVFSLMRTSQIFRVDSDGQIITVPDMLNILHLAADRDRVKGLMHQLCKWLYCRVVISIRDDVYAEPPLDHYSEAYYVPDYWSSISVPLRFNNLKNFYIAGNNEYCLRCSVFYDGYLIGTITLIRAGYNFDEQELLAADYAALLCAGLNHDNGRSRRIVDLLAAAYAEKTLSEEDMSLLPDRFYSIVLREKPIMNESKAVRPTNDFLGYLIHKRFNDVLFSFIQEKENGYDLLVITPTTDIMNFSGEILELMKRTNRDFLIGISEPASPNGLVNAFAEARHAVNIGQYLNSGQNVLFYRELGIYRFFNYPEYDTLVNKIMDSMQDKLNAIDQDKATMLTDTLSCLVRNDYNYARTADEMFTHANTIRYRIGQIEELWGMDLSKEEDRELFRIMYRLLPIWKKMRQTT